MSKKKERSSVLSKLSPLVKSIFITCIFASVNQLFSIVLMIRNVDNHSGAAAASADVLHLLEQKQEENQRLVQKLEEQQQAEHEKEEENLRLLQQLQAQQQKTKTSQAQVTPTRVLIGIFSYDSNKELRAYRCRFRELFDVFINDYRVCSLGNFETAVHKYRTGELDHVDSSTNTTFQLTHNDIHNDVFFKKTYENCQYIYTFVIGANRSDDAPTLIGAPIVDDYKNQLLYPKTVESLKTFEAKDLKSAYKSTWTDMTLLNIQENMNDGKSQTWFHYASLLGQDLGIDYVGKKDTDTIPYLDRFFDWMNNQNRLPPAPYNKNILIGNPVNKDWWWQWKGYNLTKEQEAKEQFFRDNFQNHFHIYAQGQYYILSIDLAYFVAQEAQHVLEEGQYDPINEEKTEEEEPKKQQQQQQLSDKGPVSSSERRYGGYIEGHEDHDVAAMAFHSPYPIQFQLLTKYQLFWRHGVKNRAGINSASIWTDEVQRMRDWVNLHTNTASSKQPKWDRNVAINSQAYVQN